MEATKQCIRTDAAIPLIAALPFAITMGSEETEVAVDYDPVSQLATFKGGRDFSTCRVEGSVRPLLGQWKADTKKDD